MPLQSIVQKPLTPDEVDTLRDNDGYIKAIVSLDFDRIIAAYGIEEFNDLVETELVEQGIMNDIYYKAIGTLNGSVLVEVTCQIDDL